ncbi:MAG: hypothetical protein JXB23_05855 [Candidatus Aminicenantes bacterium]|nr:hypothetical protein [Candidatus Aminicenantes bacterium]
MAIRQQISVYGSYLKKSVYFLGFVLLTFFLISNSVSCQKSGETGEEESLAVKEGIIEFGGTVKLAYSKFIYIPEASGFDIVLQGDVAGGIEGLVGKMVQGQGKFSPEMPAILAADTIEVKDESGQWQNVFTKSGDVDYSEFIDLKSRDVVFPVLENLAYNKAEGWEGKEKAKIYGKLEKGEDKTIIVVFDDKNKQVGSIIVDGIHDFAEFYIQKLRLFDKFWFYMNVKETVDYKDRRRTRELFHAEILFAGLY